MTATNHALTGALIATVIKQPALALPLAFASHFVLDALPHFGYKTWDERKKNDQVFLSVLRVDALILTCLVFWALSIGLEPVTYVGALAAVSPDFAWVYRFAIAEKFGQLPPRAPSRFNNFHARIQTLERPWGIYLEAVAVVVLLGFLTSLLP